MPTSDERQVIRDAMARLLEGRPIRSNGALTIVSLAEEANVKRHLLTHRHTDLRDEFYARVRHQGAVPQSEIALRKRVTALEARVGRLAHERDALKAQVETLQRMNNVLAVEKARADEALREVTTGEVQPIFRQSRPRSP